MSWFQVEPDPARQPDARVRPQTGGLVTRTHCATGPLSWRLVVAVLLSSVAAAPAMPQDATAIVVDDLGRFRAVGQARLPPGGDAIAYTVSSWQADGGSSSDLRIMDVETGESRSLGPGGSPRWSPDGA